MPAQNDFRIYVIERDIYARQAIVSYLSWDRHTRVLGKASSPHQMFAEQKRDPALARLDVVILDASLARDAEALAGLVKMISHHVTGVAVVCLAHQADHAEALAARNAGARAYYVREQVGVGLASAVRYALRRDFVVTEETARLLRDVPFDGRASVEVLPERRQYPRLTDRVEEALWLCVVEGLPAERAAEEMGVSTSTVRSYIKEGYRILEAGDDTVYPPDASPAERAFLRYTALGRAEVAGSRDPYQPAA